MLRNKIRNKLGSPFLYKNVYSFLKTWGSWECKSGKRKVKKNTFLYITTTTILNIYCRNKILFFPTCFPTYFLSYFLSCFVTFIFPLLLSFRFAFLTINPSIISIIIYFIFYKNDFSLKNRQNSNKLF